MLATGSACTIWLGVTAYSYLLLTPTLQGHAAQLQDLQGLWWLRAAAAIVSEGVAHSPNAAAAGARE